MPRWSLALLLVLVATARPAAHDLERTTVHLRVAADGAFTLRLAHDPSWLLLRMDTFAGGSSVSPTDASARDARLRELAPQVIDRVVLWIDGREVRPAAAEYISPPVSVAPGEFALASYTLHGRLPASARTLRWYYGLVADAYPFTVTLADGSSNTGWVLGDAWSTSIPLDRPFPRPSRLSRLREYAVVGFAHVLPNGLDHILFVIALFLASARARFVPAQIATFTVAHMVSIGVIFLGAVALPSRSAALLVAASIIYIAIENLRRRTLTAVRLAVIFLFALMHALGFASTLTTVQLPRGDLAIALFGFNSGVEVGQLTAVAAIALLVGWWRDRAWYHARVVVPASLFIAAVAAYWTVFGMTRF